MNLRVKWLLRRLFDVLGLVCLFWLCTLRRPRPEQVHVLYSGGRVVQRIVATSNTVVYTVRVPGLESEYGTWPFAFVSAPVTNRF